MTDTHHHEQQKPSGGDDELLRWLLTEGQERNDGSNSVVSRRYLSPPSLYMEQVEHKLVAAEGSVKVGVDTFSTLWRLGLAGRPIQDALTTLRRSPQTAYERQGMRLAASASWLKSSSRLGQTLVMQNLLVSDISKRSVWVEGRHFPEGVDDRAFLCTPSQLLDWHDDAVVLLDKLGFEPMRGKDLTAAVDATDSWPVEPLVRRVDLAADFYVEQETGRKLMRFFRSMKLAKGIKRSCIDEEIAGSDEIETLQFFRYRKSGKHVLLRVYCKRTETVQKRDQRRTSELAHGYGTWIRIEAEVRRKGDDALTIPELCREGRAAELWSAIFAAHLGQEAPCPYEHAEQLVAAAAKTGTLTNATRDTLLGYITGHRLGVAFNARTRRDRTAALGQLGIGSLVEQEDDATAYALLNEALDAWRAWAELRPDEWRQQALDQQPVRSDIPF